MTILETIGVLGVITFIILVSAWQQVYFSRWKNND